MILLNYSQIFEISRSIVVSKDKIFRGLLHDVCTMKVNERKVAFATLSSISLHKEALPSLHARIHSLQFLGCLPRKMTKTEKMSQIF